MCSVGATCLPTITFRSPLSLRSPPAKEAVACGRSSATGPHAASLAVLLPLLVNWAHWSFPELHLSLVFKRWIFLLCLCYLWLNIEEIPRFQYQMLLGNFPGLNSPSGKPGGAKPLQGKWKLVDPSTCDRSCFPLLSGIT